MRTVAEHYQHLLAAHYVWMFGIPLEEKVAEQRALLQDILGQLKPPVEAGAALDLGSGPGFQAIALAQLGYGPVIAVDSSQELLRELEGQLGSLPIETRQADLTTLATFPVTSKPTLIVCMGDTLTHLPAKAAVQDFFRAVFCKLASGGAFVITYRDLTRELVGVDRFLPVRSDNNKILTCFLEYESEETVVIHDLVHIKEVDHWRLEKSSYRKCRLAPAWIAACLRETGFRVEIEGSAGSLLLLVARRD